MLKVRDDDLTRLCCESFDRALNDFVCAVENQSDWNSPGNNKDDEEERIQQGFD